MGLLNVSQGPAAKGASLAPPFTAWPRFVSNQRVLYRSGDHFVIPVAAVFRATLASSQLKRARMLPCAKANTGISGAIIAIDRAPVRSNGETAAKYDILESRSQEMENQLSFSGRRESCTRGYGEDSSFVENLPFLQSVTSTTVSDGNRNREIFRNCAK
jgi:hypothetical protein